MLLRGSEVRNFSLWCSELSRAGASASAEA